MTGWTLFTDPAWWIPLLLLLVTGVLVALWLDRSLRPGGRLLLFPPAVAAEE